MFLGIDLGTSGVKAVILDEAGSVCCQAEAPLLVLRARELWSEQDPDSWWQATQAAVMALPPAVRVAVTAIGLAGQMHGATLLGDDDRPLRPAILWNDGRSFAECEALERKERRSRQITGNLAMPGFTAPKLSWVRDHEPEIFAQVRTVLLPKDYLRLIMTGEKASDMSDAAGTLWLDVENRIWSDAMLEATGLSQAQMPALFEGTALTGCLRPDIAAAWGMGQVPVAGGAGDNAAGAVGVGVVRDGDALLSLGTSGVLFVTTGEFRPNPERAVHAFCHCLPGLWHQMSVHLSAASCLDWAALQLGTDVPGLLAKAEQEAPGSGSELFLPYLSGERTPHNNPHVRAGFLGLGNETTPERLALAVLEGVAFAHADGLAALREAGTSIEELSVIGGGSRSRFWGRIIASSLDVRLRYLDGGDIGPSLGAARLARMAFNGEQASDVCLPPATRDIIEPDPALAEPLAYKFAKYRRAYATVRDL